MAPKLQQIGHPNITLALPESLLLLVSSCRVSFGLLVGWGDKFRGGRRLRTPQPGLAWPVRTPQASGMTNLY